jgi:hypothetical protein
MKGKKEKLEEANEMASLIVGNEDEETLKDIAKAVKEDNKEIKFIYKLRKFFYDYAKQHPEDIE